jgi:Ser/Thr protein kinase RdoA (MazF antagonist)
VAETSNFRADHALGTKGLLRVAETACIKEQSAEEIEAAQAISEHALPVKGQSAEGGSDSKPR